MSLEEPKPRKRLRRVELKPRRVQLKRALRSLSLEKSLGEYKLSLEEPKPRRRLRRVELD